MIEIKASDWKPVNWRTVPVFKVDWTAPEFSSGCRTEWRSKGEAFCTIGCVVCSTVILYLLLLYLLDRGYRSLYA